MATRLAGYRHSLGLATEQSLYNLTARTVELEVVPAVQEYGMGLIWYSPLAGGLLSGALKKVPRAVATRSTCAERSRPTAPSSNRGKRCAPRSVNVPRTSRSHGCCTSPRSPRPSSGHAPQEQLLGSLRALNVKLSPEILAKLDEIFPGPGGPAPEAYAW